MFHFERLDNETLKRIECPGTERHYRVSRPGGYPDEAPGFLKDGFPRFSVMIETYLPLAERICTFEVFEDDVWVVTFPKCGTTWTQEMVWLLNNGLNFERAKKLSLDERFPFLELTGALTLYGGDTVTDVERLPRPRHIKSHLPAMLLPDAIWTVKPKIIYVSRGPKDAATSFYHHYRNIVGYDGPREDFFNAFLSDNLIYAPFGGHAADYWKLRDEPNVLFLSYEQMKRDLRKVIAKTAAFLGKSYNGQQIEALEQHLSVESMRANKSCNMDNLVQWARKTNYSAERKRNDANQFQFIRSGKINSFEQDMDEDFVSRFDEYERKIAEEKTATQFAKLDDARNLAFQYQINRRAMSFKYSEITDLTYLATRQERNEPDYVLVSPTDYSKVPIQDPNWKPKPSVLTSVIKNIDNALHKFEVLPDDVWLASYPKSGTTWCQEMVWLICNDLDYKQAADLDLVERFPSMKLSGLFSRPGEHLPFKEVLEMPRPRFIKTHLHVGLLPEQIWTVKPKIVYVHRIPKSVAVSFYHHSASFTGYKGTLEDFIRSFMRDLQLYSPYHEHVIEYNLLSHLDNVLILRYEDLKKDLLSELKRVCQFFNKQYSDEQLEALSKHLSFESMKDNPSVNFSRYANKRDAWKEAVEANKRFMRKGKADGYKEELSAELQEEMDAWTRDKIKSEEYLRLFV